MITSVTGTTAQSAPRRPRDAAATRALLLDAALRRFTVDGYATTTVRQIADDAGVNVALISRYFSSKEGLFEACLAEAADALRRVARGVASPAAVTEHEIGAASPESPLSAVAEAIVRQAIGTDLPSGPPNALLLMLRSSGDPAAEQMRLAMLRTFSEKLAEVTGWDGGTGAHDALLRAQVVLAAAAGIAILRTGGLEPLMTASYQELLDPVADLVEGILGANTRRPGGS